MSKNERWMREALAVASAGLEVGELPIGAVVVLDGAVVSSAHTEERTQQRLLVHAELLALNKADRVLGHRRGEAVLFTTLEPCLGCLGAAMATLIGSVVYALPSPSDGAVEFAREWDKNRSQGNIRSYRFPAIEGGVLAHESRHLFEQFVRRSPDEDPRGRWARTLLQ